MGEGVVVTRPDGVVVSWGASVAELTGYAAEEAVGRVSPLRPTDPGERAEVDRATATALTAGRASLDQVLRRRDGSALHVRTDLHLLLDADGAGPTIGEVHRPLVAGTPGVPGVPDLLADGDLLEQVVGHAVVRLAADGTVLSWSLGATRVKGYAAHEIVGRHFSVFYTEADRSAHRPEHLLDLARRDGLARDVGWRVRADGTLFWGEISINALHDPRGEVIGFLKVTRDQTAQKVQADEAQRIYRALGHDLRNPLAAARGYVALATEALTGEEEADPVEMLRRSSLAISRLGSMLDELLGAVSHADAPPGSVEATPERTRPGGTTPVDEALGQALADLSVTHDVSRVRIDAPAIAARVDALDLERVLANLVSNALRYSEGAVDVRVRPDGDDGVRIAVADAGRGIHPDDLPTIFDLGSRGRLADAADGGHGDGLASVRHLVEVNGGDVSIDSAPGRGTTVEVVLRHAV
ncbi:MAG TPA: ATP-binding protein [Nocardioides sp.]